MTSTNKKNDHRRYTDATLELRTNHVAYEKKSRRKSLSLIAAAASLLTLPASSARMQHKPFDGLSLSGISFTLRQQQDHSRTHCADTNDVCDSNSRTRKQSARAGGFFKPNAIDDWLEENDGVISKTIYSRETMVRGGSSLSIPSPVIDEESTSNATNAALHKVIKTTKISTAPKTTYPISVHSIQGKRPYMEDEYFINQSGSFFCIMDGHGGNAVSKYLRQNLYARYLQAKASTAGTSSDSKSSVVAAIALNNNDESNMIHLSSQDTNHPLKSPFNTRKRQSSLQESIEALTSAFEKIDTEVQRISHWSYQGSTAVAAMLHEVVSEDIDDGSDEAVEEINRDQSKPLETKIILITANVGDSRAVLSRSHEAIELTKDHKPNDPAERERIESLGGKVQLCGQVTNKSGKPLRRKHRSGVGSGVYRINGNLALSRAIGDRSEKPLVSSKVDIKQYELDRESDEFVILASDGLWDVFKSSQEVVDFCHQALDSEEEKLDGVSLEMRNEHMTQLRKKLAEVLVEEALQRGSMDNISAGIIWLAEKGTA